MVRHLVSNLSFKMSPTKTVKRISKTKYYVLFYLHGLVLQTKVINKLNKFIYFHNKYLARK